MRQFSRMLLTAFATFSVAASASPGDTEAISVNTTTGLAVDAWDYELSADGRHVVFATTAPVTNQNIPEYTAFVYVRDRELRRTTMVSLGSDGRRANGWCDGADISADGRYVIMDCMATNMIAGDSRAAGLVLHDRVSKANQRVALVSWATSSSTKTTR